MFGVLANEVTNVETLYKEQELLNQLAFAIFSFSQTYSSQQTLEGASLSFFLNKKPREFIERFGGSVQNRTSPFSLKDNTLSIPEHSIENLTEPLDLELLEDSGVNLPAFVIDNL